MRARVVPVANKTLAFLHFDSRDQPRPASGNRRLCDQPPSTRQTENLHLCTAYPQSAGNIPRSDHESTFLFVTVSQHSPVSSASFYNLDSTPKQRRPSLQRLGIQAGARS